MRLPVSTCPADNTGTVGNANYPLANAGLTVTGTCVSGYGGSARRACQSNGVWAPTAVQSCTRLTCDATTMGNANFAVTDSLTTATGTCLGGYSGSPTSACTASGTWGAVSNPCTRTQNGSTDYIMLTFACRYSVPALFGRAQQCAVARDTRAVDRRWLVPFRL